MCYTIDESIDRSRTLQNKANLCDELKDRVSSARVNYDLIRKELDFIKESIDINNLLLSIYNSELMKRHKECLEALTDVRVCNYTKGAALTNFILPIFKNVLEQEFSMVLKNMEDIECNSMRVVRGVIRYDPYGSYLSFCESIVSKFLLYYDIFKKCIDLVTESQHLGKKHKETVPQEKESRKELLSLLDKFYSASKDYSDYRRLCEDCR